MLVVATPIGNLEDVTLRAIRVLGEVDLVAAEDTRRTRQLLDHLGISRPVVAYYDAVESARAPELVRRLLGGESIALVSDAGTPLVADPGFRLVRAAIEAGIEIVPVPGPSAPLALLACAGLPPGRLTFVGFLPSRAAARRREIATLADRPDTLLFFESPRRLVAALRDLAGILGPRPAAVGRELTKHFEEVVRDDLPGLAATFAEREARAAIRGEIVLAVGGRDAGQAGPEGVAAEADAQGGDGPGIPRTTGSGGDGIAAPGVAASGEAGGVVDNQISARLAAGEPLSAAVRAVAKATGRPRREVYQRALRLKDG